MDTYDHTEAEFRHKALRFLTAGSVDDGKSTLIGRLLLDSQAILADQLDALNRGSSGSSVDLSQLTDGLEAEREQGITIDVAYRYFTTPRRKFIIADAPGHEQYTRNMVTAAAGSDAAVVLVDITKLDLTQSPLRLLPQTRRHSLLAQLLRVPSIVFAVNKLDAQHDPQHAFERVRDALVHFSQEAGIVPAGIVPVSALRGDNVAVASPFWDWYAGPTLLQLLESLPATETPSSGPLMLPVQYVAREGDGVGNQFRTFWGRLARGRVHIGDLVSIQPSGEVAQVVAIHHAGSAVGSCVAGQSAGLVLDRHVDVSRGDWIVHAEKSAIHAPLGLAAGAVTGRQVFEATLAWFDVEPAAVGRKYWLRHGHRWVPGCITEIVSRLDIHTLVGTDAHALAVNDIGRVRIQAQSPLPLTDYAANRVAGAMIVVDPASHRTSGVLLVEAVS